MNITDHARDPFDLLTAARPTDDSLETTWTSTRSDTALERSARLSRDGVGRSQAVVFSRRRSARRWAALGGVAATMALLGVVAPALLGRGSTSATAAITPLIAIAENADPVVIPAGHFLRIVTVENPDGLPPGSLGDAPLTRESWMSSDGHVWRRVSPPSGRVVLEDLGVWDGYVIDLPGRPITALDLPTDSDALETLLRRHVQGSNSRNEAVFEATTALLRAGVLPPKVRAASLEVLASLPEVTAAKVSVAGEAVVRVEFADDLVRKDETKVMLFDPATATLLEEAQTFRGATNYRSVITSQEVVAAMPPGLADQAAQQEAARKKWMVRCNGPDAIPDSIDCSKKPVGIN